MDIDKGKLSKACFLIQEAVGIDGALVVAVATSAPGNRGNVQVIAFGSKVVTLGLVELAKDFVKNMKPQLKGSDIFMQA